MQRILITLILITLVSCKISDDNSQANEVERVVKKMNFSLANQQLDELLACYSNEMDWENSFGWTIRNKDTLGNYFRDWLFPKYPTLDSQRLNLKFKVKFVDTKIAWVDVVQKINSEDMNTVARTYRQTHLLVKERDSWLIKKTRFWIPIINENPPIEFISSPSFFK